VSISACGNRIPFLEHPASSLSLIEALGKCVLVGTGASPHCSIVNGNKSPPEIVLLRAKYDDVQAILQTEGTGTEA
jgi:hypothetical protein